MVFGFSDSDIEMMAEEISADGDQTKNNNKVTNSSNMPSFPFFFIIKVFIFEDNYMYFQTISYICR